MSKVARKVRLNKWIAEAGVASRRKADEMISEGLIKINGKRTYELGVKIEPHKDTVTYKGKVIRPMVEKKYYAFHKPRGVVTTLSDPEGRPTIADYFPKSKLRLFPVGRLDWDTEGLLLVSNDGDFTNDVIHPKKKIPKTYLAKLDGQPTSEQLAKLKRGVSIIGGKVKAVKIERLNKGSKKYDWIRIVVYEGKNRQIRRMFEKIGYDVVKLKREAIGDLKLGGLKKGQFQELKPNQLKKIFKDSFVEKMEKSATPAQRKKNRKTPKN